MPRIGDEELSEAHYDAVITVIRNLGGMTADDDAIYMHEDLELLVPTIARIFVQCTDPTFYPRGPKQAMIQIFDCITRFVEDPSLLPDVDLSEVIR